mmetsp:Transcript_51434/g.130750  ORF Transcript_51434/g.130750 Transcript_51434/m.130750 type:complete len:257 (+) Transcript_51434:89-859(+)
MHHAAELQVQMGVGAFRIGDHGLPGLLDPLHGVRPSTISPFRSDAMDSVGVLESRRAHDLPHWVHEEGWRHGDAALVHRATLLQDLVLVRHPVCLIRLALRTQLEHQWLLNNEGHDAHWSLPPLVAGDQGVQDVRKLAAESAVHRVADNAQDGGKHRLDPRDESLDGMWLVRCWSQPQPQRDDLVVKFFGGGNQDRGANLGIQVLDEHALELIAVRCGRSGDHAGQCRRKDVRGNHAHLVAADILFLRQPSHCPHG